MIKKHQTRSIYANDRRTSLKHLLKKTFEPIKGSPILLKKTQKKEQGKAIAETFVKFYL